MNPIHEWQHAVSRRSFLTKGGLGLGAAALWSLLNERADAETPMSPLAPRRPHIPAKAKHVIYMHMIGSPSQLDLFENKPALIKHDGETCPDELLKGKRFAFLGGKMTLSGSKFKFAKRGQCGHEMSELLPKLARVADELCMIHSLHTDEINHGPAQMFLRTGFGRGGRPAFGSWVSYGLGSENHDLPAYVVLLSGPLGGAGTSMWSSGFLPSVYQGIQFRSSGDPVLFLSNPKGQDGNDRRQVLDAINDLNRSQLQTIGDPEIATRIEQYEMAFRMQTSVPELNDLSRESAATLNLYGAVPGKASFANNCLLARRLVERGVRVVELYDSDWDHHGDLVNRLSNKCKDVDRGIAALIVDLERRGLLDSTLLVWGAEFGRTPLRQLNDGETGGSGRDHHKDAYTMWLAGAGVKAGASYGRTDEFGFNIVDQPVHVHDLNATVLHLLGLDHERLTYKYQGREFRLTDVHGNVVSEILT